MNPADLNSGIVSHDTRPADHQDRIRAAERAGFPPRDRVRIAGLLIGQSIDAVERDAVRMRNSGLW